MKSHKSKKIFLGVLLLILSLVWWDNLKLFYGNSYTIDFDSKVESKPMAKNTELELAYKTPRVNPFKVSQLKTTIAVKQQKKTKTKPVKLNKPSSMHKLLGVLKDKELSQAVVNSSETGTTVMALDDSVGTWKLTTINLDHVIFKRDKNYDTLWLEAQVSLD